MQQEPAFVLEQLVNDRKNGAVVLVTHVLEHSANQDLVEMLSTVHVGQVAVIRLDDLYRQTSGVFARVLDLFGRNAHSGDFAAACLGCVFCKATPAAANVQHPVFGLDIEFVAQHFQFFDLGVFQRFGFIEKTAGVLVVGPRNSW